jgi:tRNA pseudouridine13 synthase
MTGPVIKRVTPHVLGSGGWLSRLPEDFIVSETLPYRASGEGEHVFVQLTKTAVATPDAVAILARCWNRPELARRAGWAGLKDRWSVATQWISLPWPMKEDLPPPVRWSEDGARVETVAIVRHSHKLKLGHVASNHFDVRVRDVSPGGVDRARQLLASLAQSGVPLRFGPQRFGRHGDNAEVGLTWLRGERPAPRQPRLARLQRNAVQAWAFNRLLDRRIDDGTWCTVVQGDLVQKHDTGGMFVCDDPATDTERARRLEVSATGPMFGAKMRRPDGAALAGEEAVAAELGLDPELQASLGAGTRRALRFPLDPAAELVETQDGFRARFDLPSGAYATVLLDELVKPDDGPLTRRSQRDG